MPLILTARPIVEDAIQSLKQRVQSLKRAGRTPFLKVILVGEHAPSLLYTQNKKKFCEGVGAKCEIVHLPGDVSQDTLLDAIARCNVNPQVHGCFIQLPLPLHLGHLSVEALVAPKKDVDGFHNETIGRIYQGEDESKLLAPCTPKGIIKLLKYYQIAPEGKHVVIIGRSYIVGRPLSLMMTNHHATVTLCHSRTLNLKKFTTSAEIIVSAVGRPSFLDADFIGSNKPVVVDVGINMLGGKLCGDAKFHEIAELCSGITPVPGGVGKLTVLSLIENLVLAAEQRE